MIEILNFVEGQFRPSGSGEWLENRNPATGEIFSKITSSNAQDVELAVRAAQRAFPRWSKLSPRDRAHYLRMLAKEISTHAEKLATAESMDSGKPITTASQVDIPRSAYNFEFFADAATQFSSECHQQGSLLHYTLRQALGVVACISPWNLPLYLLTWKIAPALAAGNTVVAKPSEITPLTAYLLGEICQRINLPEGVLNIIQGTGQRCGEPLVKHPVIKAVSFTGSTAVGIGIAEHAAKQLKKCSLELGGKNPFIIFADADLDLACEQAVKAAFSNQGQICLCGSRILIESSIYETAKQKIIAATKKIIVGNPMLPETQFGAVVSKTHFDKISYYIQLARQEGGRILTGDETLKLPSPCEHGYFIAPTLFEGLSSQSRCNQEEIFGPVATLQPFNDEAEALKISNDTPYGLAASIWTQNLGRAQRVSQQLESGIVWVNCWMQRDLRTPFGGVKNSGMGREGGWEALRFFTEAKNVTLDSSLRERL